MRDAASKTLPQPKPALMDRQPETAARSHRVGAACCAQVDVAALTAPNAGRMKLSRFLYRVARAERDIEAISSFRHRRRRNDAGHVPRRRRI